MLKRIYKIAAIVIIFLVIGVLINFIASTLNSKESRANQQNDDDQNNFYVSANAIKVTKEDTDSTYYKYEFIAENATKKVFKDTIVKMDLDSKMYDYISSGILTYEFPKCDVVPVDSVDSSNNDAAPRFRGTYDVLGSPAELLSDLEIKEEDCFKFAGNMTVKITWDGGGETHKIKVPVVDER